MTVKNKGALLDWKKIRERLDFEPVQEDEFGNKVKCLFIGTVMNLTPSGKYYALFTSNQTEKDVREDQKWWEKQERQASRYGLSIDTNPGCPTDVLAVLRLNVEEEDDD